MPRIESVIDAYLDVNLLIVFAYLIWRIAEASLRIVQRRRDYRIQLRAAEALMALVVVSPFLGPALIAVLGSIAPGASVNIADLAITQFLDGRVQMKAQEFESILGLRQRGVEALASAATPLALATIGLFVLGFLAAVLRLGRSILTLDRILRRSYTWRRFDHLVISLSDDVRIPFSTRGLFRRHVVLPSRMLARPDDLRMALAHELQHMRRRDVEVEIILALVQPFFFWNPAFYLWKRDVSELRELACDQALVAKGKVTRAGYAECLLSACRAAKAKLSLHQNVALTVPFIRISSRRNHRVLLRRISTICDQEGLPQTTSKRSVVAIMIMLAMVTLFASSLQRPADWSQDRLMLSTVVNLERLALINGSSTFGRN